LVPDDPYRLVFVTSAKTNALSANIADYNAFVANVATGIPALNALGATWKCIGSTAAVNANENTLTRTTDPSVPIYRLDGALVATNNADLWDGSIAVGISITESGNSLTTYTWTGTTGDGTRWADHRLGSGTGWVLEGYSMGTNAPLGDRWVYGQGWMGDVGNLGGAATPGSLYALSGVLIVPGGVVTNCGLLALNWGTNSAAIVGTNVTLTVPYGTVVTNLNPACTIAAGATVLPASGSTNNFTSPVNYTVTARDGVTKQTYRVTVVVAPPSTACAVLAFNWGTNSATINGTNISLSVPHGTALASLILTFTISPLATVTPASGVAQDYTSPVNYTVTAQDGVTKQTYRVTVTPAPLALYMSRVGTNLVFNWDSAGGKAYNLRSTAALGSAPATWGLAQAGLLATPGGGAAATTLPLPDTNAQFYILEEYPDTQVGWNAASGHFLLAYGGVVQVEGMVGAVDANGQPVTNYPVQFNDTQTPGGMNVEQTLSFAPMAPQPGVKLIFNGMVSVSAQAFPVETLGPAQTRFPYVRNSVGLSRNLRNNAIYDRYHDWAVIGPGDGATRIQPGTAGPDGLTFAWQSRGTNLQFTVYPRYYREHLGLAYFDPQAFQPSRDSISGYCTWWAYQNNINQQVLDAIVNVFAAQRLPDFGYQYLQIDAGYCGGGGSPQSFLEWDTNKFPGGAAYAVSKIRSGGMKPGIWVHRVYRSYTDAYLPAIGQQHPDWFVTTTNGTPFQGSYGVWCCNTHNDAALEGLVRPLYRGLQQQGWDYVKIDGAGDCLYSMREAPWFFAAIGSTPEATLRLYDQTAREILGPNVYLLDCWGTTPGVQNIGIVDGCRLGSDGFQPANLSAYNAWNGVVWRNDPDHCDILAGNPQPATTMNVFGTGQANADTVERPCVTSLAGAMLLVSDTNETYLVDSNLEGMKRSSPVLFTLPGQLYNVGGGNVPWWLLEIDRPFDHWSVLAHFNWRQQSGSHWPRPGTPATVVKFSDLGLQTNVDYLVFEFWTQTFLGKCTGAFTAPALDTNTAVQIFAIREARAYPWVISTTRHISQGGVSLLDESWDTNQLTLSGQSAVVVGDPYVLTVYLPPGYQLQSATAGAETVQITNQTQTATLRFVPSATKNVSWQMTFTR